uniref:Uncharacterized protein n=1 Tax=Panagrolaimus davidi TaxID=227884 RepID=A0A914PJT0_9BILA
MTAIRYKQNEIEYHKSLAMGKRRSSSSTSQSHLNPPPTHPQNNAPTWLPLVRILPFLTPQMQLSSQTKDKKHYHHHQQEHDHNILTESLSTTTEDDNVFLPSDISPLKLETKPFKHHQHQNHSPNLSPTNTLSPTLSHSDTLSPNDIHVPIDSLFHGTKKLNKKTNKKRKAVVAGKAICLADLESKLIGTNGEKHK